MKNKAIRLTSVALLLATATFAQRVENDDMYFNSSDRVKLNALRASEQASYSASIKKSGKQDMGKEDLYNNTTDSYSARNINPEFAARSNSQTAQADDQDYFVSNYQYQTSTNLNNWNNSFNNSYNNPWYSANYFGPSINSWNSPYYGSAYDSWGNPWCNPYYRSGWSSSFSFYWGNSWNYGGGYGMGMGYGYGNPYSNWGPSYGYGYGYGGGGGFYYPGTVIVVNNYGESGRGNVAYGKRATRGTMATSPQEGTNSRTRSSYVPAAGGRTSDGGRVAATGRSQGQEDYYNRSWKNNTQNQNSAYPSRSSTNNSWSNTSNGYNRSSNSSGSYNNNNSSSSPSRSSSMSSGSTRSSAPASSGSSGRSRGRD
jgi:hypothetical protein